MPKVTITRGLPASGKTTWAKQFLVEHADWIRVNKDELRQELLQDGWSKTKEEKIILPARNQRIVAALKAGKSVIVDDTNLAPRHEQEIRDLVVREVGVFVDFEIKDFEISVEEAIRRDSERVGAARVGEKVIRGMARQFLQPASPQIVKVQPPAGGYTDASKPWAVICDLDGTIALCDGVRNVYDGAKCHLDNVNPPVLHILNALKLSGFSDQIIFLSGREDKWRDGTLDFLNRKNVPYDGMLYMRATGDNRDDTIVKQELFDQHVRGKFNVRFVLDDRNKVVDFWRAIGLTCLQVADGNF